MVRFGDVEDQPLAAEPGDKSSATGEQTVGTRPEDDDRELARPAQAESRTGASSPDRVSGNGVTEYGAAARLTRQQRSVLLAGAEDHGHPPDLGETLGQMPSVVCDPTRSIPRQYHETFHASVWSPSGWQRTDARPRRISLVLVQIERNTRMPSRAALRLLTPCTRSYSQLGTSTMTSPAVATIIISRVSTSKPVTSMSMKSRQSRQNAL